MNLAARSLELGIGLDNAKLLLVDKGMGIAIEHIMRQQAQRKRTTQVGIARLQVRHAIAQTRELTRHARAVHDLSKRRTVGNARRQGVEEKRVGTLVSQDKGDALLVGRNNALRKTVDAFLAKQMMGDKRRHDDPFDFIRCHPLCPPHGHAKPAVANDGVQTAYASPRCALTSAARRRDTGTVEPTRLSLSSIRPVEPISTLCTSSKLTR